MVNRLILTGHLMYDWTPVSEETFTTYHNKKKGNIYNNFRTSHLYH